VRERDTLAVRRHGWLDHSIPHLVETVRGRHEANVGFRSLTEEIDITTSDGAPFFHSFGTLAQSERNLIHVRNRAVCRRHYAGRSGGRKPVMTETRLAQARALLDRGLTSERRQHGTGPERERSRRPFGTQYRRTEAGRFRSFMDSKSDFFPANQTHAHPEMANEEFSPTSRHDHNRHASDNVICHRD